MVIPKSKQCISVRVILRIAKLRDDIFWGESIPADGDVILLDAYKWATWLVFLKRHELERFFFLLVDIILRLPKKLPTNDYFLKLVLDVGCDRLEKIPTTKKKKDIKSATWETSRGLAIDVVTNLNIYWGVIYNNSFAIKNCTLFFEKHLITICFIK